MSLCHKLTLTLVLYLVSWTLPSPVNAQNFIRLTKDGKGNLQTLETSIVRYSHTLGKNNLLVDLISAVHVGEKSYYETLNHEFKQYDAVLYELVAPKEKIPKIKEAGSSTNPISLFQLTIKNALGLEFQLEAIDYTKSNFVHADMSPDEFSQSMRTRDETFFKLFMRAFISNFNQLGKETKGPPDIRVLFSVFDYSRAISLRRLFASEFKDAESFIESLEGPQGSTLVSERNKVALKVLSQEIGKGKKKLAIFYGGGHMRDMSERLHKEFGLAPTTVKWLAAWKLMES